MPPELHGVLYHAERHLRLAKRPLQRRLGQVFYQTKKRRQKHYDKMQKLVMRAAKMMEKRNLRIGED